MQKYFLVLFFWMIGQPIMFSQSMSTEEKMERYKEEADKKQDEYIASFISTLEVDEFQKHIIKQKIKSYFEERIAIHKSPYKTYEKKDMVTRLKQSHFKDIENMVSKETMSKILEAIEPDKDKIKTYKKHKRNKKKKND